MGTELRRSEESEPQFNAALIERYNEIAPFWNSEATEGIRRDDLIPEILS